MTLSTDFLIQSPVDVEEVWSFASKLVIGDTGIDPKWKDDQSYDGRTQTRMNLPMQDLPAWLIVQYMEDGTEVERNDDDDGSGFPAYYIDINFDTAYGFRDDNGRTCTMLHVGYIVELVAWCSARGLKWLWHNEYSGNWHDNLEALAEFLGAGDDAMNWFENTVKPVIAAEMAAKGAVTDG